MFWSGGGALNFGLRAMCHQKDPTFFRSLSPKDPHIFQLSPNDPLFFENVDIFDKMLRKFWPFWPWKPLFFMHFTEKSSIFERFVTEKPPFLMQFVTERPLHLRCLVALVRHFHMWLPPPRGFGQSSSSLDPNFCSQDPHFSIKIDSLDPSFWNVHGTHRPKKLSAPQTDPCYTTRLVGHNAYFHVNFKMVSVCDFFFKAKLCPYSFRCFSLCSLALYYFFFYYI